MSVLTQPVSTHPVVAILLLHGVCVEEADDCAKLRLPVLFMNVAKQEQRHKHVQVMEVIQLPDAEGFPLHDKARLTPRIQYADIWSLTKVVPVLLMSEAGKQEYTYAAVAFLCGLVDHHSKRHPVTVFQLLSS